MKKFLTLLSISFFVFISTSNAQQSNLEGTWILDNTELYQHTSNNDSTKINNNLLPTDITDSGAFTTLSFTGNSCTLTINGSPITVTYSIDNDSLYINLTAEPLQYNIIDNNGTLTLYRKYYHSPNPLEYGVKLQYTKQVN